MYYYAVHKGHTTGIYTVWADAEKAINGYSGAVYRRFTEIGTAEYFVKTGTVQKTKSLFDSPKEKIQVSIKPKVQQVQQVQQVVPPPKAVLPKEGLKSVLPKEGLKASLPVKDIFDTYYSHDDYSPSSSIIHVYCDGSTLGNGRADATGGYGVFIAKNNHVPERRISERLKGRVTNNIAELKALNRALEQILLLDMDLDEDTEVEWVIHYDSQYAVNVVTGKNNAKANLELVEVGKALLQDCRYISLIFHHVYSHTGATDLHSIGNSIADILAGGS